MAITEALHDEYKHWTPGIYVINAPTGEGKTRFILNEFYNYVVSQKKKMALFVNRTILRDQVSESIKGKDILLSTYQKIEYNAYLKTIEYMLPPDNGFERLD